MKRRWTLFTASSSSPSGPAAASATEAATEGRGDTLGVPAAEGGSEGDEGGRRLGGEEARPSRAHAETAAADASIATCRRASAAAATSSSAARLSCAACSQLEV